MAGLRARLPRMQALKGDGRSTLTRAGGAEEEVDAAAAGADVVALYFSASWCGPCRGFTPVLARAHEALRAAGGRFEVVLVSLDSREERFEDCFAGMPWLAVPFGEAALRDDLGELFGVQGIPALVLLRAADGGVLVEDGVSAVRYGDE